VGVAGLILAIALFYPVENWRGRRAWKNCPTRIAARGEVLDWTAYIPAQVPDQQNMFKAPKMAEWFVAEKQTNWWNCWIPRIFTTFVRRHDTNANPPIVAEIKVVASETNLNLEKSMRCFTGLAKALFIQGCFIIPLPTQPAKRMLLL